MKKIPLDSTWDLKALAWVGLLGLALAIFVPLVFGYVVLMKYKTSISQGGDVHQRVEPYTEPLGALGSHCGGAGRLPCGPGLNCVLNDADTSGIGICQKVSASLDAEAPLIAQLGESCGDVKVQCAAGLYCKTAGTCAKVDTQAPYSISTKLEGMQPENGLYYGEAGKTYKIIAQAINTDEVTATFVPSSSVEVPGNTVGAFTRGKGGLFTSTVFLVPGMKGNVVMRFKAANGDASWLSLGVASKN